MYISWCDRTHYSRLGEVVHGRAPHMLMTTERAYSSAAAVDLHNLPPEREGSLPVESGKVPSALRSNVPETHKDHVMPGETNLTIKRTLTHTTRINPTTSRPSSSPREIFRCASGFSGSKCGVLLYTEIISCVAIFTT